jgi:hypothetical protein
MGNFIWLSRKEHKGETLERLDSKLATKEIP